MNTIPQSSVFSSTRRRLALSVTSLAAAFALTQSLPATPLYWDLNGVTANSGTASSGTWDGTNVFWNTDSTGGSGGSTQATTSATDDLFFSSGSTFTAASAIVISGAKAANSVTFQQTGAVTLSGTGLTLGGGTSPGLNFSSGAGANIISAPITLADNATFTNSATTTQTVSGGITGAFNLTLKANSTGGLTLSTASVNNGGTITNSGSSTGTTTISGVIGSNVTGITQNSATSSLSLSGANTTYAGTTTLTTGTLKGTNTAATNVLNAFGTGGINLNGGTLQLRANGTGSTQTIVAGNNVTLGSAAVTVDVNNNGANTGSNITFTNLSVGTGQLNVTGGNSYTLRFSGTTTLTGNATFNATTAGLTLVGNIGESGGSFGFTKMGAGTLTLAGASTYTGVTSILDGTLTLVSAAPSGSAGALGNATSEVLVGDTSGSLAVTITSTLNGNNIARNMRIQSGNTGTVTLNSAANGASATGNISGNITLGTDNGTGHGVVLTSGTGGNAQFATATYGGIIRDPTGLQSGTAGLVTLNAVGSIVLSGNNTYSGGTVMNTSNVVRFNNNNAFGTGNLSIVGGTIQMGLSATTLTGISSQTWDGNFTFNNYAFSAAQAINMGTSPITLTGNRIVTISQTSGGGTTTTVGGAISGSGRSLQINGPTANTGSGLILNGASTFDGGLTIAGGATGAFTLSVRSGNASALGTGQVRLTNSSNSILTLGVDTTVDSLTSGLNNGLAFTGGTGSTNGTQTLVFTNGVGDTTGAGAAGTVTVAGGIITGVTLTNLGTGYTAAPTITFAGQGTGTVTSAFGSSSINLNPGTARTLTIAGTNGSPATYSGIISGTNGNLIKNGSGTQILTGINSYTGSTQVNGGVLNISGAGLINATSSMTVGGGDFSYNNTSTAFIKAITLNSGTVSGTGNLSGAITVNGGLVTSIGTAGAVTLNAGGGINPGDTGVAGTFSASSLTWNSNDTTSGLRFDLGVNTAASDMIALDDPNLVTGTFNKGTGSTFIFNFVDLGYTPSLTYTLLTFTGGSTGFSVGDFSATGIDGTFVLNANDLSFITAAAVPEPAAYAAIFGALVLVGAACRHRRSRSL